MRWPAEPMLTTSKRSSTASSVPRSLGARAQGAAPVDVQVAERAAVKPLRSAAQRRRAVLLQIYLIAAACGLGLLTLVVKRRPYLDVDLKVCRTVQRLEGSGWARLVY